MARLPTEKDLSITGPLTRTESPTLDPDLWVLTGQFGFCKLTSNSSKNLLLCKWRFLLQNHAHWSIRTNCIIFWSYFMPEKELNVSSPICFAFSARSVSDRGHLWGAVLRACRAAVVRVMSGAAASAGHIWARQHDRFSPPSLTSRLLSLSRRLVYSVLVKWTEAAFPVPRSSLTRCCGLSDLTRWCIAPCFPSTTDRYCCRQNRAGGSWPR